MQSTLDAHHEDDAYYLTAANVPAKIGEDGYLLEFFSGKRERRDDMNIANSRSWAIRELRPAEIAAIAEPAKVLDSKYHQDISRYLQHCTLFRYRHKMSWNAAEMKRGLDPIIDAFVLALPQ